MTPPFVHLSVHSEYSLGDSTIRIKKLVERVARLGMPAVGLSDDSNFFAVIKFYKAALERGIKPLIGAQVWLENPGKPDQPHKLLLYCRNNEAYRALCRLMTQAYGAQRSHVRPTMELAAIAAHRDAFIVLSGGRDGELGRALLGGRGDEAARVAGRYLELFGDGFYVELQRVGAPGEEPYIDAALQLAAHKGLPVVATNAVQFLRHTDYDTHEIRVCIHNKMILDDPRRKRHYTEAQYLRDPGEMGSLFSDLPQALENTAEIAKRCNVNFTLGEAHLPVFESGEGDERGAGEMLRERAEQGLEALAAAHPERRSDAYGERLEAELGIINNMGFDGYFLIVADLVDWSRRHGIPVGPGRGSGTGSLVAWALGITELDPIEHGLLFERFLNPERVSLPDFDIDFCVEQRDRVIEYVTERYGHRRVSQIITYGTMAARAAVRDVARVLNHSYGFGDVIARLIPPDVGITLEQAKQQEPLLRQRYDEDEEVREVMDKAQALEGLVRNAGRHAGGVVIAPSDLTDHTPLYKEPGSESFVTQFDKDDLEANGMVKFDFLGLNTLTILYKTLELVNRQRTARVESELSFAELPMDDEAAFALLHHHRITGLFQLESHGMRRLVRRLRPDSFDDLVALVALFRPGPLQSGMVEDYINRKHGKERVQYLHPALEPILNPTYGVLLYQEQVMEIARVLAGYTLGEADLLRQAMGKKKPEEMKKQREVFVAAAAAADMPLTTAAASNGGEAGGGDANTGTSGARRLANSIYDLMEHFGGYGFNKAHSTAYAMISYRCAWLKAHFPGEFMATSMSAEMNDSNKVLGLLRECREMGINVTPPSINDCRRHFVLGDDGHIRYGLGAVKGLGAAAIKVLVKERDSGGAYRDIYNLCERVDNKKVNRRALESLIHSGALDAFGAHRAALFEALPAAITTASRKQHDRDIGQHDIFGAGEAQPGEHVVAAVPPWERDELLRREKEVFGFYFSGHPCDPLRDELGACVDQPRSLVNGARAPVLLAGMVASLRRFSAGSGAAILSLENGEDVCDVRIFGELLEASRPLLGKQSMVVVCAELGEDRRGGGEMQVRANHIMAVDTFRERCARRLQLEVTAAMVENGLVPKLKELLSRCRPGKCPVILRYRNGDAVASFALQRTAVCLDGALVDGVRGLVGEERVTIHYDSTPLRNPARAAGADAYAAH